MVRAQTIVNFWLWAITILVSSSPVLAQGQGEIEDLFIEVNKVRKLDVPEAQKITEKISNPVRVGDPSAQKYSYRDFLYPMGEVESKVKVLTMKPDLLEPLNTTHVMLGGGTYGTTYAELLHNSKRVKDFAYGVRAKHLWHGSGPAGAVLSGNGLNLFSAYTQYFNKSYLLSGQLDLSQRGYYFYGYVPQAFEMLQQGSNANAYQNFDQVAFSANLAAATDTNQWHHDTQVLFNNFSDRLKARETEIGFGTQVRYRYKPNLDIQVATSFGHLQRIDSSTIGRTLFKFAPFATYKFKDGQLKAGLNTAFNNDTTKAYGRAFVIPFVHVSYWLSDNTIALLAGFSGDVDKVSLQTLTAQNPWLIDNVTLMHTQRTFDIYAGVSGRLGSQLGYRLQVNQARLANMPLFVNSARDSAKFDILYDRGGVNRTTVTIAGNYTIEGKWAFNMEANLFQYGMGNAERPWHLPATRLAANLQYFLKKKVLLSTGFQFSGPLAANFTMRSGEVLLPATTDWNLKVHYRFSPMWAAFVNLDNLLNQQAPRYQFYATRGFMVTGGVHFSI